jgi:hypothetical protein
MRLDAWLKDRGRGARAALAAEAGVTEATLSRIAGGKQNAPLSVLDAIVAATKNAVTANDLLDAFRDQRKSGKAAA